MVVYNLEGINIMKYDLTTKTNALNELKEKSVSIVSEETGIPKSTLYKWQKDRASLDVSSDKNEFDLKEYQYEISNLIKSLFNKNKRFDAEKVARNY